MTVLEHAYEQIMTQTYRNYTSILYPLSSAHITQIHCFHRLVAKWPRQSLNLEYCRVLHLPNKSVLVLGGKVAFQLPFSENRFLCLQCRIFLWLRWIVAKLCSYPLSVGETCSFLQCSNCCATYSYGVFKKA